MAFERRIAPTPAKVGRVSVNLTQELDENGDLKPVVASVDFVPIAEDGTRIGDVRTYDLWDHLSPGQQTAITNLLASLRTRADAEVI